MLEYLEKKSQIPGPTIWLTAGLHGDEPGGSAVVQTLFKELATIKLLKGLICAFPLINRSGANKKVRVLPESNEDLNRLFPGRLDGTLGEKIAHNVWQTIVETKPVLVLDLHNDWIKSVPYVLIDNELGAPTALTSGLTVVRENPAAMQTLTGALSLELNKINIPALTIELGGAYIVDEKNVRIGVNAISRILCHLGLIAKEIFPNINPQNEMVAGKIFNHSHLYSDEPRPTVTGQIKMLVEPGQMIRKGDLIAEIGNSVGEILEKLFANQEAMVLGFTDEVTSRPGQEIVALGLVN